MNPLALRDLHLGVGAHLIDVNGQEIPAHYGDAAGEYSALRDSAGVIDLSSRGRLCLTGTDRQRFLNGQVTQDVHRLKVGEGCYAALVTAKGKMVSDLNIYLLQDEILLDFEPGLTSQVVQRLEKFIIADDVQASDVTPHYGLLSIQGPKAIEALHQAQTGITLPGAAMAFCSLKDPSIGEVYVMNHPRLGTRGFDLFVPVNSIGAFAEKLIASATSVGGRICGWQALESARIESGIPRFGVDMDDSTLPPEAGLEGRAISYTKGCYIGQEVIARIRTYGHVNRRLRGLRLSSELKSLPAHGDKLFKGDKEVGFVTSATESPVWKAKIALGYVRREVNQTGTELLLRTADGEGKAMVVDFPHQAER